MFVRTLYIVQCTVLADMKQVLNFHLSICNDFPWTSPRPRHNFLSQQRDAAEWDTLEHPLPWVVQFVEPNPMLLKIEGGLATGVKNVYKSAMTTVSGMRSDDFF